MVPPPGPYSPDGLWQWNGQQWTPTQQPQWNPQVPPGQMPPGWIPARKRHTARNVALGCGGVAILLLIILALIADLDNLCYQ